MILDIRKASHGETVPEDSPIAGSEHKYVRGAEKPKKSKKK
jgi:hypothetical protein